MIDADIVEIATMLHHRYSKADSDRNIVAKETYDGSEDWQEFHKERLKNAELERAYSFALYTRFTQEHRDTIRKVFEV